MSVQFLVLSDNTEVDVSSVLAAGSKDFNVEGNQKLLILSEASTRLGEFTNGSAQQNLMVLSEASSQTGEPGQQIIFADSTEEVRAEELVYEDSVAAEIIAQTTSNGEVIPTEASKTRKTPKRRNQQNRSYVCDVCRKSFPTASNLKRHYRIHTGERPFQCKICNKSYAQVDHLKRHMGIHSDEHAFKCSFCFKTYKEKHRYIIHMRSHTGERPFECSICKKSFTYKVGLEKHKKVHTGVRNHECLYCLKKFTESQALRVHIRIHTGERPYICKFCDKGFSVKKALRNHVRIHTGERPFTCNLCLRKFISKSSLNNHEKTHSEIHSFQCKFCGRTFAQKGGLRAHVKTHLKLKPFRCEICMKQFSRKINYNIHMKSHDGMNMECGECGKKFQVFEDLKLHAKHQHENGEDSIEEGPTEVVLDSALATLARATELVQVSSVIDEDEVDPDFPDRENSFLLMKVLAMNRPPKRQRRHSVFECIQKLVTLSEVSSMQEELPTDGAPESKASKGQFQCSHCVKSFVLLKSLKRHKKKAHPGIPDDKEGDVLLTDAANRSSEQCIMVQDLIVPKAGQTRGRLLVKDEALAASLAEELKSLTKVTTRKKRKYEISKEHECPVCSKRFATPSLLRRHRVVHTGEKPYQCQQCGKKYSQPERLRRHMGTHTGINIFKCKVCGKQFEEKCRYIDHVRSHIEEKPFECEICGKVFACRVGLWKHKSIHSGDKRYYGESCGAYRFSCQQCSKQFRLKQDLIRHNRTHTGEAPSKLFPCQFCEKKFSRKVLLETHIRGHTGERPFVCQYCLKRFACKRSRACHIKLHKLGKAQPLEGCGLEETSLAKEPSHPPADTPRCHCIDCGEHFEEKQAFIQHLKDKHNVIYQEDPASATTCTSLSFQTRGDGVPEGFGSEQFNNVQDFRCSERHSAEIPRTISFTGHIAPSDNYAPLSCSADSMLVCADLGNTTYLVTNSGPNAKQSYSVPVTMTGVSAVSEKLGDAAHVLTNSAHMITNSAQNEKQPNSIPVTMTGAFPVGHDPGLLSTTTGEYALHYVQPVTNEFTEKDSFKHFQQQEGVVYQDVRHGSAEQQSSVASLLPHVSSVESTNIQVSSHVPLSQVYFCHPPERTGVEPVPMRGMSIQPVVGSLDHAAFQARGQNASESSLSNQNNKTSAITVRTAGCPTDGHMQTIVTRNTSSETLHQTEVQSRVTDTVLPISEFSAGGDSVPAQPAPCAIQSVVETETPVFPAVMQTTSGIEAVPPKAVLNIPMSYTGLDHVCQTTVIAAQTQMGVETIGPPRQLMAQRQMVMSPNESSSDLESSLVGSENVITMLRQSTDITVNQDSTISQLQVPPTINQPSQPVETYQIVISNVSKDQPIELVQEDVSSVNADQVFQQENVITISQEVAGDGRNLRSSSDFVCDIITSDENQRGQNVAVYEVDPARGTLQSNDKVNPSQPTSQSLAMHTGTCKEAVLSPEGSRNDQSLTGYPKIEDQIRKTLNDGSYPDRTSSFAPVELLEEFMPAKRPRRKSTFLGLSAFSDPNFFLYFSDEDLGESIGSQDSPGTPAEKTTSIVVKDQLVVASIALELQNLNSKGGRKRPKYQSNRVHTCSTCGKEFATPSILRRHMVVHTGEKPHKCPFCDKSYSQIEHLRRHKGTHTGENVFTCAVCKKLFVEKTRYTDHMMAHLEETPYKCHICQKGFSHRVGLQKHLRIHSGVRNYACEVCNKRFSEKQTLRVHQRIHTGNHPFKCEHCNKGFSRQKLLTTHLRCHDPTNRPYACQLCTKRFSSKQGFVIHQKLHADKANKPVEDANGKDQRDLAKPQQKTLDGSATKGDGQFECQLCSRKFDRKCSLTVHQKAMHPTINTKNLTIKCGECGLNFESLPEAQRHVRIHSDGRSDPKPDANNTSESDIIAAAAYSFPKFPVQGSTVSIQSEVVPSSNVLPQVNDPTCNEQVVTATPLVQSLAHSQVNGSAFSQYSDMGRYSVAVDVATSESCPVASLNTKQIADQMALLESLDVRSGNLTEMGQAQVNPAGQEEFTIKDQVDVTKSSHGRELIGQPTRDSSGDVFTCPSMDLSVQNMTLSEEDVMSDDWSAELSKCPAMSGVHGRSWLEDSRSKGSSRAAGVTHWPTPSFTLSTDDDMSACPSQQAAQETPGREETLEVLHTPPPVETPKPEAVPVDRTFCFLASDILKEYLPRKMKRRRSI
ncbi:uncharacterized protein LOC135463444 [Liolophura sinensis]|uniref:uncharacterized protein LOC135463444 n=1 Tax=Liolophura sinensis TaxID=3198878 RepID=UPI0031595934